MDKNIFAGKGQGVSAGVGSITEGYRIMRLIIIFFLLTLTSCNQIHFENIEKESVSEIEIRNIDRTIVLHPSDSLFDTFFKLKNLNLATKCKKDSLRYSDFTIAVWLTLKNGEETTFSLRHHESYGNMISSFDKAYRNPELSSFLYHITGNDTLVTTDCNCCN